MQMFWRPILMTLFSAEVLYMFLNCSFVKNALHGVSCAWYSWREREGKGPITFQEFCLPFLLRFHSERRTNLRIVYSINVTNIHLPIPYNIISRSSLCLKDKDSLICALTKKGMKFLYFMVSTCLFSIYYWRS